MPGSALRVPHVRIEEVVFLCHTAPVIQASVISSAERKAAFAAWRRVPRRDRVEVLKLAKQHVRHPDTQIAAAASVWANAVRRSRWAKVPPFTLPMVGIIEAIWMYVLIPDAVPRLVFVLSSCVVVLFGLLAWNSRIVAKRVLALPFAETLTLPAIEVEIDDGSDG